MPTTVDHACIIRGTVVSCRHDVAPQAGMDSLDSFTDGALHIADGVIRSVGPAAKVLAEAGTDHPPVHDFRGRLVVPGFIDIHTHCPQADIIASYGEALLTWLNRYAFPAEQRFAAPEVAEETAQFFMDELLRNGTTSALIMGTVHAHSADAILGAAHARGMRVAAGKLMMDRNCPAALQDTAASGVADSRELLRRWHGVGRLAYAISPRFAPTSSEAQLSGAGHLARECPEAYLQTHLAENSAEVAWVSELFPWAEDYLAVYEHFGLVRPGAVFAHCIHMTPAARQRLAEHGAATAFAATANLFLGSGLMDYPTQAALGLRTGLGTDIGAGTSFSLLRTAAAAYQIAALHGTPLSAAHLLYLATRGGARALDIDHRVGHFAPGMEADVVVLDPEGSRLSARRTAATDLEETLFALFTLGDERHVAATYVAGRPARGAISTGT